jgi:antitoxin component YwqK of YwqJK toxin-antitoxin module
MDVVIVKGVRHGDTNYYYSNGKLEVTATYNNGVLDTNSIVEYDKKGNKIKK